ncbi:flap structure-specific endonuclease 1, putative [Babesia caballi]|uniref:Flap endonuclease 1 n=1 Tax=Babesia caballi TaxID=5871 RepID=A0AAV4LQX5_BABCB|nr:flap structure-specific endonuclease 1, putative [Babesia caballi]
MSGTTVSIDASTALYQFTIAIRESSYFSSLTNSKGESTSHIAGLMNRCIRLLEAGIKPVFVFDSTPPEAKQQTLAKRKELRQEAESSLEKAKEEDDKEAIRKFIGRTVHISKTENESAKQLLRLMGVPVIEAEEEAEAQCAYLVKQGLADAVGTEDADALVFGCGTLLKNLTASNKKILKVELPKVLELLGLTHDEFIDFCILCGCDYCGTLKGIGPKTAYSLIRKYKTLSCILEVKSETLEGFEVAQQYFRNPKVRQVDALPRCEVDIPSLKEFLVTENNFAEDRVNKFLERLLKARTQKTQLSLRSFFSKAPDLARSQSQARRQSERAVSITAVEDTEKDYDGDGGRRLVLVLTLSQPKRATSPLLAFSVFAPRMFAWSRSATCAAERSLRWFSSTPTNTATPRVEKPVPIEVDEALVPEHLRRFICVRHFEPRVTIKRTNPREVGADSVEALIAHACRLQGLTVGPAPTPEEQCQLAGEGLLWPNPLLQRLRAATRDSGGRRLRELWRSSSSHGVSWDALDKLYMAFREARDSSAAAWDKHAPEIADFASKVARQKIADWSKDDQVCPPRLLRKWTHLLYTRWRDRYLHVYGPRMLSRYLKGEVTDRVLLRELNECAAPERGASGLPFATEASEHNPHFVRRVVKNGAEDG